MFIVKRVFSVKNHLSEFIYIGMNLKNNRSFSDYYLLSLQNSDSIQLIYCEIFFDSDIEYPNQSVLLRIKNLAKNVLIGNDKDIGKYSVTERHSHQ